MGKKGFFFFERHFYRATFFNSCWPANTFSIFFKLRNGDDVAEPLSLGPSKKKPSWSKEGL